MAQDVRFRRGTDFDYPERPAGVIVFDRDERYKLRGKTHAALSHAIKHYDEIDKSQVASLVAEAIKVIKKADEIYLLFRNKVHAEGKEAKDKLNYHNVLNTLDRINDKIQNNRELLPIEEKLKPVMLKLREKYKKFLADLTSDAVPVDHKTDDEISLLLKKRKKIVAGFIQKGKHKRLYIDPKSNYIVITTIGDTFLTGFSPDPSYKGYLKRKNLDFNNPFVSDVITEDLTESYLREIDSKIEEILSEIKYKWVIRKGRKKKKYVCPSGKKYQGGKCVRITSKEKMKRKRAAKKAARKAKSKKSKRKRKLKRSLKKRKSMGLSK